MSDFKNVTTGCTEATTSDNYETDNTPEEDLMVMEALSIGQAVVLGNGQVFVEPAVAAAIMARNKRYFNG